MPDFKLPSFTTEKFKLDKFEVISGNDTSKIYMKYDYSTMLNAFQYPNIDRVYIGITGDVYDDTTHIYKFSFRYFTAAFVDFITSQRSSIKLFISKP